MLKHFFTNSSGILFSRILGFIRDLLTASVLGASIWSDIFFVAFKLPNLFRRLFGEGAFAKAFLPNFTKAKQKGLFTAEILIKFIFITFIISLLVMIFTPLITKFLAFGFDEKTINLAVPLVRINFWYLILIFSVTFFASILQYKNHFATTAYSTCLLNISMITALIFSQNLGSQKAAFYLSWGVVVGGILQVILHLITLKKLNLLRLLSLGFKKFIQGKRADTKGFWANFFQGIIGSSAAQLSDFLSTFIASFLAAGAISYLYYANRIFQLPLALFGIAISITIFPKISKQIKAKKDDEAKKLIKKAFEILYFLLLFSSVGGFILAKEIIWLLFEHGEFNTQNTSQAAKVLQMTMLGLVPYGLYTLISNWLFANFKQKIAAIISIYSLLINLIFSLILIKFLGVAGIALAGSIGGYFVFFYGIKIFGFKDFLDIILSPKILITTILAIIFGLFLYYLKVIIYANL